MTITETESAAPLGRWHIVGAGCIGSLAAYYLQCAGADVTVIKTGETGPRNTTLSFADGRPDRTLTLSVVAPRECEPVERLIVACKTPFTTTTLASIPLAADATIVRLQNGLGSLDGQLAPEQRLIEGVIASAVMRRHPDRLDVIAENTTQLGDGVCPEWFESLAVVWPNLVWAEDIRFVQWHKLVANAAINPLTALYDVPNGALLESAERRAEMTRLITEADTMLARIDRDWPGDSYDAVADVIRATAANTSSMRADVRAGAITEIEAINGWLLERAGEYGVDLPAHRGIVERIHALEPH